MSINDRQTGLLASEDWKKIYQSFREADFQSYDFSTLRKSMIDYLQLYYPEDFNDFIESSEYIALIDLIAFLGQSLAFRSDLNARENFIDTAERRDSILRLAKLVSYVPKRNIPAAGLLKINSIRTSEPVFDSNGTGLADTPIVFNDISNPNWLEQFNTIMNAVMVSGQKVGKPGNSKYIDGVKFDEYTIQIPPSNIPTVPFSSTVDNSTMNFEFVGATTIDRETVYEPPVHPSGKFNILYKNDNLGYSSENTGFFFSFKQGSLGSLDLAFAESLKNRITSINVDGINNSDIWLYQMDSTGQYSILWSQVPTVSGVNITYNPADTTQRKIYQVSTRLNDQIDLIFGDGAFAEIPQGNFKIYYRTSNGLAYTINPEEMQNISFSLQYISKRDRIETLTVSASLLYTVNNSTARESIEEIRLKAPQQYYTQNRMVNGEDYNIFPFTNFSSLLKVKAVNRTSSGISRFLDVIDASGKFSSTNIFCQDGIFYRNSIDQTFTFDFLNTIDVQSVIQNQIKPALRRRETIHFYYEKFTRYVSGLGTTGCTWFQVTTGTNQTTGWLKNSSSNPLPLGVFSSGNLKYVTVGSLLKFTAPSGKFFGVGNVIKTGTPSAAGERTVIYASVVNVVGDGSNNGKGYLLNGQGPVVLNQIIPTDAILSQIIPAYNTNLSTDLETQIRTLILNYENFGLRYNQATRTWAIILAKDLNTTQSFSLTNAGNTAGTNADRSWVIRFSANNQIYTATYRTVDYLFESELETRFYFDEAVKIFDSRTSSVIRDKINILRVNTQADNSNPLVNDYPIEIYANVIENDGFANTNRIRVSFSDSDNDGIPDDPDVFTTLIAPTVNPTKKLVFFKDVVDDYSFANIQPLPKGTMNIDYTTEQNIRANVNYFAVGQLFYATSENKYFQSSLSGNSKIITEVTGYRVYTGRQNLYFQYRHNSPNYKRIDPSPSNIIDIFLLTKAYDTDYRLYITDTTGQISEPEKPTNEFLRLEYGDLENYKPISDSMIFSPAKYKPLFGPKAETNLRATFKVIKNTNVMISDSEIRLRVVNALNNYFSIDYWDFGETFYFSELSSYLHSALVPYVASVVIVPDNADFGNLLQINAEPDEIFINAATVDQVVVVSAITASQLKLI